MAYQTKKPNALTDALNKKNQEFLDKLNKTNVSGNATPPTIPAEIPVTQPEVIRDQDTGKITGVKLPNGENYLGISQQDVENIIRRFNSQANTPTGAVEASTKIAQIQQLERNLPLAQQVGQVQFTPQDLQDIQESDISNEQALKYATAQIIPGLVGGAVTGAVGGAAVGGVGAVPGAAIGAGLGAVGTFLVGVRSNLKSQASGNIAASTISIREGEANLRALITDTNQHPENSAENLQLYNYQSTLLAKARAKLKIETQSDLNKFLGEDGTQELTRYEIFYSNGGTKQYLDAQMQQALLAPNAAKSLITIDDLNSNTDNTA